MPRYTVMLRETVIYTVEVDAPDEDTAGEIAETVWCDSADPTSDFCGAGQGVTVRRVEEIGTA